MAMLTRRNFLAATAAAGATTLGGGGLGTRARASGIGAARNLIVVVVRGGWDISQALDPKPGLATVDSPEGEIQDFEGLDVFVHESRPQVTSFFEQWAGVTTIVRGINVRSIVHPDCTRRVLTGTLSAGSPDLCALASYTHGLERPVPYLVLGPEAYPGPLQGITASVGLTKQIKALLDPAESYPTPAGLGPDFVPGADDEDAIRQYVLASVERERATRGQRGYNQRRLDDFVRSLDSGDLLRASADDFGPRGVTLSTAGQLELAVTALETGLSWSVLATDQQMWDTHNGNGPQGQMHDNLFADLGNLAADLESRPGQSAGSTMLDETVVAVISEMSRTPRLNEDGGKDHWPVTAAMVFGGGVSGGTVSGGTTDLVDARAVDLQTGQLDDEGTFLEGGQLVAGLLCGVGVDPSEHLESAPLEAMFS